MTEDAPQRDTATPTARPPAPLFSRIGGAATVWALVDELHARSSRDARLAPHVTRAPAEWLKNQQRTAIVSALGGPPPLFGRIDVPAEPGTPCPDCSERLLEHLRASLWAVAIPEHASAEVIAAVMPPLVELLGIARHDRHGAPEADLPPAAVA